MLVVTTWLWGKKYDIKYVNRLVAGVRRNLAMKHRFLVMTERERTIQLPAGVERHAIKDPTLTQEKGCLARLRMFEIGWQNNRRIDFPILNLDLDCIIVGKLDDMLMKHITSKSTFDILQGVNAVNPCPYNGSVMMLKPHTNSEVWYDFSLDAVRKLPYHDFPDDQGWLWAKIPNAGKFTPAEDGVYAFQKPGWPTDQSDALPGNARIVGFPGWRDPSKYEHLPWVREHWCD